MYVVRKWISIHQVNQSRLELGEDSWELKPRHNGVELFLNRHFQAIRDTSEASAQCFHMQVKVAVLNAISQNYNSFEV